MTHSVLCLSDINYHRYEWQNTHCRCFNISHNCPEVEKMEEPNESGKRKLQRTISAISKEICGTFISCKGNESQAQRSYAAKKKETEIPQDAAKHKEENEQRKKRYQAKIREKQQTESVYEREKRWAKYLERLHKCTATKRKMETPPEWTAQNISPPKMMLNDRRQLCKGSRTSR